MQRKGIIAAIASPAGACARIILRISGEGCHAVLAAICPGEPVAPRAAARRRLHVSGMSFPVTVLTFAANGSYTGEESAELHLPGNPLLANLTLAELYANGIRAAEAGEFTARAFFNRRLNLTEAEGVAASIAATNQRELNAARRLAQGALAEALRPLIDDLTQMLALLEAGIDFAEEDIRFISPAELAERCGTLRQSLLRLLDQSVKFENLSHEPTIVLTGLPNAGKSTLLNLLAGRQRAIVSAVAGTTRDLLSAEIDLARGRARLVDTAGLESDVASEPGPLAEIRRQMHDKASQAIAVADVVVLIHAADNDRAAPDTICPPDLRVLSKCDLRRRDDPAWLQVSAATGAGIEGLRSRLDELAFGASGGEALALNARHRQQIRLAAGALEEVHQPMGEELAAEHLRSALEALGEITGLVSVEDVLGRIFSTFCIGK